VYSQSDMRFKDYYKILGVSENATQDEIKRSYRRLAKKYHPDANPGDRYAEERFKEVNEAYDIVGDPGKRAKYNQLRFYGRPDSSNGDWFSFDSDFLRNHGWPGMSGSAGTQGPFGQVFGQGFAFSDLLRDLFGFNGMFTNAAEQNAPPPCNIAGKIRISFLESVTGTERTIAIRQKKLCPNCRGSGREGAAMCLRCNGNGQITSKKKIRVRLPAGVENEHQLRLRGLGTEGPGGTGDVLITVLVEPHPVFKRSGFDIYCEAHVDDKHLETGTRVRIPTIDGKQVELNIPAGTKKDTVFRLKNYGVKTSTRQGDQFVKIV